jgi:cytochrome P450
MTDRAELIADLIEQIAAVAPDDDAGDLLCDLAAAAIAEAVKTLGPDEIVARFSRLIVAIHEGRMPEPPRRN